MKNFFSIIVIFAILLVGGGFVYMRQQAEEQRVATLEQMSEVRRSFAHKARAAINNDDDEAYLREIKAAISSYKDELNRTVYRENPKAKDLERYVKTVEEKFEAGTVDEARRKNMLEGYEIVKQAYEVVMGTSWKPVLTQRGKNDTRLDIYTMKQTTDPDGRPILEGKFLFWGIEDSTQVSWGNLDLRLWKKEMEEVKEGRKMVEQEIEKVLGRAEGESQPRIIIQKPHNYIDDFPSFLSIGYIWLPVLPTEALSADIEYNYGTRRPGSGEVSSTLKWEKWPLPNSWRLRDGQDWDADEVEATEEEILGTDGEEETPEGEEGEDGSKEQAKAQ